MKRILAFAGVLILVAAAYLTYRLWPTTLPKPQWATDYDTAAKPPETMTPGMVVGTSPPNGWSHLIIKSLPRVSPEHEKEVNGLVRRMTSWMFTAFVADVRPETRDGETRYALRAIGLGLGAASIDGKDTIVTLDTAKAHGVTLDFITKTILEKGYETMKLSMVVVQGPSFGIVDTPVWLWTAGKNHLVRFRYALLVNTMNGQLDVFGWILDAPKECPDADAIVLLAPNTIDVADLIPDPMKFTRGWTTAEDAFGVDRLPPHQLRLMMAPELRQLAAKTKYTPEEAQQLETALRALLPRP